MKNLHRSLSKKSSLYANWHKNPRHEIIHYGLLLAFTFIVFFNVISSYKLADQNLTGQAYRPFSDVDFCERFQGKKNVNGKDAIDGLGRDIDRVANHYGLDGEKLKKGLENDKTLRVNCDGLLFYAESDLPQESSLGDGVLPTNPTAAQIPDSETFLLHSKPNATSKIYLNFQGAVVTGTSWNYMPVITALPFSVDADPAFNSDEMNRIKNVWISISEDYAPFNVDVTTQQPTNPDLNHYTQVIFTPSSEWYGSAGGVAFVGSFRWNNNTPAWVFSTLLSNNIKLLSEAGAHEAGHTMGLYHQASYDANCIKLSDYNYGTGGTPGWGPIMGAGYYVGVTQWINSSEYPLIGTTYGCTSEQNDISIITGSAANNNGDLRFATDEAGSTANSAGNLVGSTSGGIRNVDHLGIMSMNDTDLYKINTLLGDINFTVSPMVPAGSLMGDADFRVRLLDNSMNVISESNPNAVAVATVSKLAAPAGNYYLEIVPSGYLDNTQPGGYTATGSMGRYQVVGSYTLGSSGGDTISPTVSISNPTSGATVSGTTSVSASASDNVGVSRVDFYYNSTLIGTDNSQPYSTSWVTNILTNGAYILTAKAYDAANNVGTSSTVSVTVNNTTGGGGDTVAPVVTISSPANNANVSGNVNIAGSATDNVKVTKMEIIIDNSIVATTTTKSSISYKWNTRNVASGLHAIIIKAYDAAGNIGQKSIVVNR